MYKLIFIFACLSILLLTGCGTHNGSIEEESHWILELYYAQAMTLLDNEDYLGAQEQLSKAINIDWSNYLLYFYRGSALYQIEEYEKAISDFTKAIERIPIWSDDIWFLYYFRGKANDIAWHYSEAIKDYDDALSSGLSEEYLEQLHHGRLLAKMALVDFKWVKFDADILIWMNDANWMYYSYRSIAKYNLDDSKWAIKDASKSIELSPEYSDMRTFRWYIRMELGYYSDAIKDFGRSIELNPENEKNYRYRWLSNAYLKNYTEATKDFKYALKLDPWNKDLTEYIKLSEQSERNTRLQNIKRYGGSNNNGWWFDAWYEWAEEKWIYEPDNCGWNSDSFIEGCIEYAESYQEENYQEEDW